MTPSTKSLSPTLLSRIAEAINSIQYGYVQITVQDSQVVQLEKVEKIRVKRDADLTAGGAREQVSRADRTTGSSRPHGS